MSVRLNSIFYCIKQIFLLLASFCKKLFNVIFFFSSCFLSFFWLFVSLTSIFLTYLLFLVNSQNVALNEQKPVGVFYILGELII